MGDGTSSSVPSGIPVAIEPNILSISNEQLGGGINPIGRGWSIIKHAVQISEQDANQVYNINPYFISYS
jgi:hypothetical protein